METLADTWFLWLILAAVVSGLMVFYRESRRSSTTGTFASQDEFSIKTILLGFKRGEGDLFVGYVFTMIFFSLFLAGFVRWIRTII